MTLTASVKRVTHNKLQQQVAVIDHSLCTGQGKQHVTVTHRSDKSLRVDWTNFALWKNLSPQHVNFNFNFNFISHKFCDLICCDLLLRQNYVAETKIFTENYPKSEEICRRDVSPRHITATCRLVCTDLNDSIITTVSKTSRSTLNNLS